MWSVTDRISYAMLLAPGKVTGTTCKYSKLPDYIF